LFFQISKKEYNLNLQDYQRKRIENPDWEMENVIQFPVCDIMDADHQKNNEARVAGLNAIEYAKLKANISGLGYIEAPIGLTRDRNGKARGNDGYHRVSICRELYEETKDPKWLTIPAVMETFNSQPERKLNMLNANLPIPQAIATSDDLVATYHSLITEDFVLGSDYSEITKKDISNYIKDTLQNPMSYQAIAGYSKRIFRKLANRSSKYYCPVNDKEIVEMFNDINPFEMTLLMQLEDFDKDGKYNWPAKATDSEGQEWAIYSGKQLTWFNQNIVHYALNKKNNDKSLKIMVIGWNSNLSVSKKDECPVANFRKNSTNIALGYCPENNSLLNESLIDKIVYLPQITKGQNEEDMKHLYDYEGEIIG
tara:strand:- start:386 stop:1489 length:1104 start_codon:yes stop_codon:yes gene_type:complete